ncbi:MAG: carboxypeptidase regulatory-like domain-containing protein, partial [Candidatus Methanosuratus sp.]|nr:carboxypeptidase regulatory-like domain-containing protein [Candidatus Methanosuratincola sp.]
FSAIASGDYSGASDLISYLNSSYVPEDARYIFSRFNSLLSSAVLDLNQTETMIGAAWGALRVGDLESARSAVGDASVSLWRANQTASQAKSASSELASKLRISALRGAMAPLDQRIEQLSEDLSACKSELERAESGELTRTSITISLDRNEAWVGSIVTAYGTLTTEGGDPLPGTVYVAILGWNVYTAAAGADGSYSLSFLVPYAYVDTIRVYAYFAPDGGLLVGSRSQDATLALLWVKPEVSISLNATRVMPGQSLQLSGNVLLPLEKVDPYLQPQGLGQAQIRVSAFGSCDYCQVQQGGAFSTTVVVPGSAKGGNHTVVAEVVPSGVVGPASSRSSVEVYRQPTSLSLEVPIAALSGTSATVSGRLTSASGEGIDGATVRISAAGESYTAVTGVGGLFALDLPLGISVPTGRIGVEAVAVPGEAHYSPSSARSGFYAVNPSLPLVLAGGFAFFYMAVWRGVVHKPAGPPGSASAAATWATRPGGLGLANPVIAAYHRASAAVGKLLGRAIGKSETLREFLRRSEGRIGEASEPFSALTTMAEEELYAGRSHEPAKASSLLERILSALSGLLHPRK